MHGGYLRPPLPGHAKTTLAAEWLRLGTSRCAWLSLDGVDNYTRAIDFVRIGAVAGIDSGTRGTYHFDALRLDALELPRAAIGESDDDFRLPG